MMLAVNSGMSIHHGIQNLELVLFELQWSVWARTIDAVDNNSRQVMILILRFTLRESSKFLSGQVDEAKAADMTRESCPSGGRRAARNFPLGSLHISGASTIGQHEISAAPKCFCTF